MKERIFAFFLFLSISVVSVSAQESFSKWHSSYFDRTFDIKISNSIKDGVFDIYVHALDEKNSTNICLNFTSETIVEFKAFLEDVKTKYIEWKNIAIANNVSEMTKEMDFKTPSCTACWYWGDEWHFSFGVKLKPTFMILDDGRMIVMLLKEFTASDNRYITNTLYMVWGCEEDIDSMIAALNIDEMRAKINSKINAKQLFN